MYSVPHPSAGTMLVSCRAPRNSELYRIGAERQQSHWRLHFELESVGERSRWVVCHVGSGAQKQPPSVPLSLEVSGSRTALSAAVHPRRSLRTAELRSPLGAVCRPERTDPAAPRADSARRRLPGGLSGLGVRGHIGARRGGVCSAQHGAPVAAECH